MRFPFPHDRHGHAGRSPFDRFQGPAHEGHGPDAEGPWQHGRGQERGQRFAGGAGHGFFGRGRGGPFGGDGFGPPDDGQSGRRGRGARPFEQGDLRWLALDLIAEQPRHGYEIIRAIEELMNGHYSPSPGVVYPTLTWLEETGLIAGEADGARKRYSITDAGRAELDANAAQVQAVRERLRQASARFGNTPPPELHRAMGNLRAALQVRLSKGALDAAAVASITAALDEAARRIEQA